MSGNRLGRKNAAEYLTDRLGLKVTPDMLAKWATQGTGPSFAIVLGKASYSRPGLDDWAELQLADDSAPRTCRRKEVWC